MPQDAAVDWSHFISTRGKAWKPSAIRGMYAYEKRPNMISFLAGKPNPETYPFVSISMEIKPVAEEAPITLKIEGKDLEESLQYGPTPGLEGLVSFLKEIQVKRHGLTDDGSWSLSVGTGSQDLLAKTFQCLLSDGDSMIVESPAYPGVFGITAPQNVNIVEAPTDKDGLVPEVIADILENWSTAHPDKPFPKLIYSVPTGSNPSGCTTTNERKIKILELVYQYNLLFVEDDAYFYLHYHPDNQPSSYLELEQTHTPAKGRVIRLDTFSKILSAGMRIGFITAAKPLMTVIDLQTANSNLQTSSTTQAMALALFRHWGYEGFIAHTRRVGAFYKSKLDTFEALAHKHLDGIASWVSPDCGMFIYMQLLPDGEDSYDLVRNKAIENGVLALPGSSFMSADTTKTSPAVRLSFSLLPPEDIDEGLARLKKTIVDSKSSK